MGVYLVDLDVEDWRAEHMEEHVRALEEALAGRGLPPYEHAPDTVNLPAGHGRSFQEPISRPRTSFEALSRGLLEDPAVVLDWDMLVPIPFTGPMTLPVSGSFGEETVVRSAHEVRDAARVVTTALCLPPQCPAYCDGMDVYLWLAEVAAGRAAAGPGPWRDDLDATFHAAVCLRAAEHAVRVRGVLTYV